jgi:lysozyme
VRPRPRRVDGIDVSHHQGPVAWTTVAGEGYRFAYLKATEGSTFTDPRFAENWREAADAGLRVGGYHYFSLCSDPLPQAEHFVATLAAQRPAARSLPPVVDLELIGNCDPPPSEAVLRASVEQFIDAVEVATDERVVVYTHPDLDARYDFTDDLDRRRWVRRPGRVPPPGDWWIWQRSDTGTVAGIGGPVDLDVMRVRPRGR